MAKNFTSNIGIAIKGSEEALRRAAEIIGGMAESYAKQLCPVDTGLLRNSITHGVSGGSVAARKYEDRKGQQAGHYAFTSIPQEFDGVIAVVIGSNVQYAPYVELGTSMNKKPRPYLRPAIENHIAEYQEVLKMEVQKG